MRTDRQTAVWYDRLATLQEGYQYPWRSMLPDWHGEDAYVELVRQHARPDMDVLDAACGHGDMSLIVASQVRSVLGYDRTAAWIEIAQRAARERAVSNATFVCHDSSAAVNGGRVRLPAADHAFDLLICSKGPFHWIEDARRVARPGAILLMLVPDAVPLTRWHSRLPAALQWEDALDPNWARPAIEQRLQTAQLALDSWWSFDVPEVLPDPEQLYIWLTWGCAADEVPSLADVHPILARIFSEYGTPDGVEIRHHRYLWKAVCPS
ncbi:MAG: methyltransferase domain-containing protein [Chloroflexi bacterium]|nr:methyltransferase domain-containing protein [Chloroflexota bacterium]